MMAVFCMLNLPPQIRHPWHCTISFFHLHLYCSYCSQNFTAVALAYYCIAKILT